MPYLDVCLYKSVMNKSRKVVLCEENTPSSSVSNTENVIENISETKRNIISSRLLMVKTGHLKK